LALLAGFWGCSPFRLFSYAVAPDAPRFTAGERIEIAGLRAPVDVALRADGIFRIRAADDHDAALAEGYLMARDRMAQLDLFRHIARGELAALIGVRPFGERTSLEMDVLNRFLGFRADAARLYAATSAAERAVIDAFVVGINAWILEEHLALEHRLLGVTDVRPWTAEDSLAIYAMLMHGLSANADRETRRLVVACRTGLAAMERIWPTDAEFAAYALPDADLHTLRYPPAPAVVPEIAAELESLCPSMAAAAGEPRAAAGIGDLLYDGWSASNNWAVAGTLTASGKPVLSSDPHLPHMNPPLVWGVEIETSDSHVAGFVLPGLGRVVFGHNGHVAWSATTNHVDRQDLVVLRPRTEQRDGKTVEGYEFDGELVPFELRTESFAVNGGESVEMTARFTRDGPLLNDIDSVVRGRIPLTALRRAEIVRGADLDGAHAMSVARNLDELAAGLNDLDLGCSSWVAADAAGSIAYRSPCVVPVREGFSGAFPIPGWLSRYEWRGYYEKGALPAATDPARGWLATANNQIVPSDRFPSTYNADVSAPNRYQRIEARLMQSTADRAFTAGASAALQLDLAYQPWASVRAAWPPQFCRDGDTRERKLLCGWDGEMSPDSVAATLFVLFTNALLDRALADEFPDGKNDEAWHFVQSLPQFEARVHWLWQEPEEATVWDDVRTAERETRADILEAAFADALALARERFGADSDAWAWGDVRPFVLRHAFATNDGVLGWFLNASPLAIGGGPETVFKNQFTRADRERMNPAIGPIVRFTIDMADPWAATYSLAGGQSGWPMSSHYGDLLDDWAAGRGRALTPPPAATDIQGQLLPAS